MQQDHRERLVLMVRPVLKDLRGLLVLRVLLALLVVLARKVLQVRQDQPAHKGL